MDLNLESIAKELARREGFPVNEIRSRLETLLEAMVRTLAGNGRIEIRGWGSFSVRTRKPRWSRDIRRNKPVFVPSRRSPVFLCSALLKRPASGPEEHLENTDGIP